MMISRRTALSLLAALAAPPAWATPIESLRGALPDARVIDHRNRRRRLVSDLMAGRVVAVDFVLTGCASFCHLVSASMAEAQDLLRPQLRAGRAGLLSLGLDPISDTPAELGRYAERFEPGPNWSFVNMPHAPLETVLRRLGGPEPGMEHAPMVVVIDAERGEMRRLSGLPEPETIATAVEAALAARRQA